MSEELSVHILFPKTTINEVQQVFSLDKNAAAILEFSIQKYPKDILPSSQIYIQNDSHTFDYVSPETLLSEIFTVQQTVYVVPEQFDLKIQDPSGTEHKIRARNNFILGDIIRTVCIQGQLNDPRFYDVKTGDKVLDQTLPLTVQAPFATSLTMSQIPTDRLTQLLVNDFQNGKIYCSDKDKNYILGNFYLLQNGEYKTSMAKPHLERGIKALAPKTISDDKELNRLYEGALSTYKKLKMKASLGAELCKFIMDLNHFDSMITNGERYFGAVGKRPSKDKCTISLGFSILKIYKLNSTTVLESYPLYKIKNLQMDGPDSFKFEYGGDKSTLAVKIVSGDCPEFFTQITQRLKSPSASGLHGSRVSDAGTEIDKISIPSFAQMFTYYSDVPRNELSHTVAYVSHFLINGTKDSATAFSANVNSANAHTVVSRPINREWFPQLRLGTALLRLVDESMAMSLNAAFEEMTANESIVNNILKEEAATVDLIKTLNPKKPEYKKQSDHMMELHERVKTAKVPFEEASRKFSSAQDRACEFLKGVIATKSAYQIRDIAVECARAISVVLFMFYWFNDQGSIDEIKAILLRFIQDYSTVDAYTSVGAAAARKNFAQIEKFAQMVILTASNRSSEENSSIIKAVADVANVDVNNAKAHLEAFYRENPPVEPVAPLTEDDVKELAPDEMRQQVAKSKEILNRLQAPIEKLSAAEDDMKRLRDYALQIMGIAAKSTTQSAIIAFNEVKVEVERNYANNSATSQAAACVRCVTALEAVFQSTNPAPELMNQLAQFPADDARIVALIPIIQYLDKNGPLYQGSSTHVDLSRFISQMSLAKTATLVEIAFTVESHVPEDLRKLTAVCDPCKDMYPELDGDLDIQQLSAQAKEAAARASTATSSLRQSVRDYERECAKKYRALNVRLWRVMNMFTHFAHDEQPSTVGHRTFQKCREVFKVLIEEAAYDMKRDRSFMPFITEFTERIDAVVEAPRRSEALSALGAFLLMHQTRKGFAEAARALSDFNHFVLCEDSDRAARELAAQSTKETEFRSNTLMITQIRSRFVTIINKTELAMKAKFAIDIRRSHVDLRQDFASFITKFTDHLFIVFSQLIVAQSRNQAAIQQLATGCEAIEKLFPLIMNIEFPAPYLARSVCGIALYSMDGIVTEAKALGGKAAESAQEACQDVREFLFNVRRKIADSERELAQTKTGIGIADMQAVIDRETRSINSAMEFQRSIRRRIWKE